MVLLELFAGIGGFAKGFQDAGFKFRKHYYSEVDTHAKAIYQYNFPEAECVGSVVFVRRIIRQIQSDLRPNEPLILTFGSPCQDFSMAGKRTGLLGKKSHLIKFAFTLIRWLRPHVYIWENVKGAYTSNNGKDYWAIQKAFANIPGYRREQQLLNTEWVLPQNRERIYYLGHLAGGSFGRVFPFGEGICRINEGSVNSTNIRTLTAGGKSGGLHSSMTLIKQVSNKKNFGTNSTKQQDIVYDESGIMACLSSSRTESKVNILTRGHGFKKTNEVEIAPTLKANSYEHNNFVSVKAVLTLERQTKRQNGRRLKEEGESAFTLNCQDQHGVMIDDAKIRRLTEIECERLQGFPDDWTKYGIYQNKVWINKKEKTYELVDGVREVPKTARYRTLGNAVTAKIVKLIALRLKEGIHETE